MTSETGTKANAISILPNISKSLSNQTMKFGQLMERNVLFFFKNHAESEAGRLVPDHLFFKKALMKKKQVVSTLVLVCLGSSQLRHEKKTI